MRTALTVAGSDSIGGAGIQADVKAMSVVGVHAASVITAVTAQNTCGVDGILPIPEEFIKAQLEAVLKDCDIKAVKTGMLYSAEIVGTVADILEDHEMPLIVDPVMVSGTGSSLSDDGYASALKKKLLPMCELVTPNKHEAEVLAKMKIKTRDDLMLACELIGKQGSSVLMKGGHFNTPTVVDYLYLSSEFTKMEYPRLRKAGHGSGCVLSSFITANMAKGLDIVNAVLKSRELIQESISSQYAIGKGDVVVNTMVKLKGDTDKFQILDALDAAAAKIVDTVPDELVPKGGMNIAMALKDAAGPEEIAAIDKRMVVHNGILRKNGPAKFGTAEGLSYILLTVMKHSPETRCIMSIAYGDDIMDVMEEVGMTSVTAEMGKDKFSEATEKALRKCKGIPDAIVDKGPKKDRVIRILAKDTEDMLAKLEEIL
ncbi:MAG: bifunctional hydroxymethylpyrimidine kinase/phosphomethylpyrimidine kinase [Methanomassiliicoccales archaeon Mx-03]|nr:bifunctional hydroxymethylpyrimidine kinase/phosphomethylpyrimidine kinase [Methanomassiliicoccaceae archaeon DOK]TQS80141.1 MAG: bifunctional hydroxymethylpyrimidine kinase/phosphomethylpyrimidine kinase [Methanomassiliicoccales archaeon Mx-03]